MIMIGDVFEVRARALDYAQAHTVQVVTYVV